MTKRKFEYAAYVVMRGGRRVHLPQACTYASLYNHYTLHHAQRSIRLKAKYNYSEVSAAFVVVTDRETKEELDVLDVSIA